MNLFKINDILPLVRDRDSCLEHKCKTMLVPLPPSQISKSKSGIKRILEESSNEIAKRYSHPWIALPDGLLLLLQIERLFASDR